MACKADATRHRGQNMTNMNDKALIHHLLRRAGFGGSHEEIESYAEIGYDQTVDKLLDPESTPHFD